MRTRPGTRNAQITTNGLGQHFESPKRPRDPKHTRTIVSVPIVEIRRRRLLARLNELQSCASKSAQSQEDIPQDGIIGEDVKVNNDIHYFDPTDADYVPSETEDLSSALQPPEDDEVSDAHNKNFKTVERRILPDPPAQRLCASWKALIPTLIEPYQHYASSTLGKPLPTPPTSLSLCKDSKASCLRKSSKVLCLFFDRKYFHIIRSFYPCLTRQIGRFRNN